ncbi:MAG: CHASE domain-containing protein [Bacteriovorax sp.]|nr:CHASE domain-containing protein [Bacteriovorax sp.]
MHLRVLLQKITNVPALGWGVLIFGLSLTIFSSISEYKILQLQKKIIFESENLSVNLRVKNRLNSYENTLIQIRAFVNNADEIITREKFHKYVNEAQLFEKNPGIQSLAYIKKINFKNLKSHVLEIKKSGLKGYRVWPAGKRDTYYPIIYLEPPDLRIQEILGFDMFSEKSRRLAIEKARDSGLSIITKKLLLVNEHEKIDQVGLIAMLPMYKKGKDISTLQKRQLEIVGFVVCVFQIKELFNDIFIDFKLGVDFEIYDGQTMHLDNLLYDYDNVSHFNKKNFKPSFEKINYFNFSNQTFTMFVNSAPLFSPTNKNTNFWILVFGITITLFISGNIILKQNQAKELLKIQTSLKESVAMRDEFLSIASHELRTPMTIIKLQAQMFKKTMNNSVDLNIEKNKFEKIANQIIKHISTLNRLVEDMLDIARLRTGKLKIEIAKGNLADLINESVNLLLDQMTSLGYPPPIVEIRGNLEGNWDFLRLGQVLTNILINALRYGNQKVIRIKAEDFVSFVRVTVTDQGIGIADKDKERIFERFERATASNIADGLGLGLYIAKQIITAHNGKLWVESKISEGSSFIFEIPKNNTTDPSIS